MDGYWKISLLELVYTLVRETEIQYINKNSWDFNIVLKVIIINNDLENDFWSSSKIDNKGSMQFLKLFHKEIFIDTDSIILAFKWKGKGDQTTQLKLAKKHLAHSIGNRSCFTKTVPGHPSAY